MSDKKGFANMTAEDRSRISSMGGKKVHALGKAYHFEEGSEKTREAGRKGGLASAAKRRHKDTMILADSILPPPPLI